MSQMAIEQTRCYTKVISTTYEGRWCIWLQIVTKERCSNARIDNACIDCLHSGTLIGDEQLAIDVFYTPRIAHHEEGVLVIGKHESEGMTSDSL